jgi:hypothetical protein
LRPGILPSGDGQLCQSRKALDALVAYVHEQGRSRRPVSVGELFVPNIQPALAEYLKGTGED